jgi:hypothetical protein
VDNILNFTRPLEGGYLEDDTSQMGGTVCGGGGHTGKALSVVLQAVGIVVICVIIVMCATAFTLSNRLERAGWVVYYRTGCRYCDMQQNILKSKFRKFIESDWGGNIVAGYTNSPPISPLDPAITGFPFWLNTHTGEALAGVQGVDSLKLMLKY